MRLRLVLLVATMMAVLAVASGVAVAAAIDGTRGDDRIKGTNARDQLTGHAGDDVLIGLRSADNLDGDGGRQGHHLHGPEGRVRQGRRRRRRRQRQGLRFQPARLEGRDLLRPRHRQGNGRPRDVLEGCNRVSRRST